MSNHRNLLQRIVRRQVRFQDAIKERIKDDKVKSLQIAALTLKTNQKRRPRKQQNK